jgi:hypothetical protein
LNDEIVFHSTTVIVIDCLLSKRHYGFLSELIFKEFEIQCSKARLENT